MSDKLPNKVFKLAIPLLMAGALLACNSERVADTVQQPSLDHSGLPPLSTEQAEKSEYLSGGDATTLVRNEDAFSRAPRKVDRNIKLAGFFNAGDHIFRTPDRDIGPLLNTGTCQGCHLNDGRGVVPKTAQDPMFSMLVKLGDTQGRPDPVYGDQLQPFAIQQGNDDFRQVLPVYQGSLAGDQLYGEAHPFIEYELIDGRYPDGHSYQLRKPVYKVKNPSFDPFIKDIRFSARVAPQAFGVGLLAEIPQQNILALVDEDDSDGDGVSGRASMVVDAVSGKSVLGRFAYKAQNPTVLQQVAGAYSGDIGITTSIFPNESCTAAQTACEKAAARETQVGEQVDFSDYELALVEFYNRVLAVPARRGYDATNNTWSTDVAEGRKLFFQSQCIACHVPRHVTGEAPASVLGGLSLTGLSKRAEPIEVLSNQTIYPYTDLLLHDMGGSCQVTKELANGDSCEQGAQCLYVQRCDGLADGLPQGDASASEWKTPALWGVGLVQTVNPDASFLHDGRARTIEEAILWHGGEAELAKQNFMQLQHSKRQQLLAFVKSL